MIFSREFCYNWCWSFFIFRSYFTTFKIYHITFL